MDLPGLVNRLRAGHWILMAVAVAAATLFSGLGLWQADRHVRREARNDTLRSRLAAPPLDGSNLRLEGDSLAWRRVRLRGRYDYRREIVLRGRAYEGTPGVYVVTPLRREAAPAILVVRGWLPAADGLHAPLSRGRPSTGRDSTVAVRGVLLSTVTGPAAEITRDTVEGAAHLVASHVNVGVLADSLPYAVTALYAQRTPADDRRSPGPAGRGGNGLPAALSAPAPDPGPHLWYSVQWFGFALIAVGGTAAYLWHDLREDPDAASRERGLEPGRAGRDAEG